MSSLALMRWLEATPLRYDAGMRVLTLGRVGRLHAAIVEAAAPAPGARVLEIGCGTGAVTEGLVASGALVTALDQNPEMLEQARVRLAGVAGAVDLVERTAAEIDGLPSQGFDAVVASLCLSEMSAGERAFVLCEARNRLRPGGVLVVGDEVRPRARWSRWLYAALRVPQAALAWLVAGSTSRPIPDLPGELRAAGLDVRDERYWLLGSLSVLVAERPQ